PVPNGSYENINIEKLEKIAETFTGNIMQVPPAHSAIKKNGKRAYTLARQGEEVQLEPRSIIIHSFLITQYEPPIVHFKVTCSTGTYIRSLANDFGKALGCGAYLSSLRRTRIGEFNVNDAVAASWLSS
ncbi:MAG TPA: tRNA pseudouridine(55) synthase, partial [Chitinophagaceae bacterium]|nr:tRNA pseudouridine(55) synthase [Chitinophagaceae bacterium]